MSHDIELADRPARSPSEIEITLSMIEAGVEVARMYSDSNAKDVWEECARSIYLAMRRAALIADANSKASCLTFLAD
jgi:hypothetical protein